MTTFQRPLVKESLIILFIAGLSIWACWPLFSTAIPDTHDTVNAVLKHLSMSEFFGKGQILPRWVPDYAFGYGYPVFNFYPPMFFLISGALSFFFKHPLLSINMASVAVTLACGLGMYLLGRELWGRAGGLVSAAAYLLLPYRLVDLYVRGAYAELTSFVFLPLIFWGILVFTRTGSVTGLLTLTFSITGLFLTHNVITMIFIPAAIFYALVIAINNKETIRKTAEPLLIAFLTGGGMAAFFWIPALAEQSVIRMSQLAHGYYSYASHFLYIDQIWNSPWGYGISSPGKANDGMCFQLGVIHIGAVLLALFAALRSKTAPMKASIITLAVILLSSLFMTLGFSDVIWSHIKLLQLCQFPWRFLTIAGFAASALAGGAVLLAKGRIRWILAGAILIALIAVNIPYAKAKRMDPFPAASQPRALRSILPGDNMEFLPLAVKMPMISPAPALFYIMHGVGTFDQPFSASPVNHSFAAKAQTPLVGCFTNYNFPGWRIRVDGKETSLIDNRFGLIMFLVPAGEHTIQADFTETPVRKIAAAVSWLALAALIFSLIFIFKRLPIA